MQEKDKNVDNTRSELNFSFLDELPEDQLMDINGAAYLINHFWDHRHITGLDLSEMAIVLESTSNQTAIAQRIIGEMERVGGCSFKNLPQYLVNEEIIAVSDIWNKKFSKMQDSKNPNWREQAEINLQKMMKRNSI
jgi:hypothetical protein